MSCTVRAAVLVTLVLHCATATKQPLMPLIVPGWEPSPSGTAVQNLVDRVESQRTQQIICAQGVNNCDELQAELEAAKEAADEYSERAERAAESERQEERRVANLPILLRTSAERANAAHEELIEAQHHAANAYADRLEAEESAQQRVQETRDEIDEQRIKDRLEAAETARVAQAVAETAEEIRCRMEREKLNKEAAEALSETAAQVAADEVKSSTQTVLAASNSAVDQVKEKANEALDKIRETQQQLVIAQDLKVQADRSEAAAADAKEVAAAARARADAALGGSLKIAKGVNGCEACRNQHPEQTEQ